MKAWVSRFPMKSKTYWKFEFLNCHYGRYTCDVHKDYPVFKTQHPPCQAAPKFFHPLYLGRRISNIFPLLFQMITNWLKGNMILGWLYVIRSFLQFGFRFQYQFNNLVWLSADFFSFSWGQHRPHSNIKNSISFSPFFYSEKTRWGQGWAEASLSTFSWFYVLVCAVLQKYHEMFS